MSMMMMMMMMLSRDLFYLHIRLSWQGRRRCGACSNCITNAAPVFSIPTDDSEVFHHSVGDKLPDRTLREFHTCSIRKQ